MATRLLAVTVIVLLAFVAIGVVSLTGTMEGAEAAARTPELAQDGSGRHLPYRPVLIEAELIDDGRTVLLAPHANGVAIQAEGDVQAMGPACWFADGKFYAVDGEAGPAERVWLFAVVAEDKPEVSIQQ